MINELREIRKIYMEYLTIKNTGYQGFLDIKDKEKV